MSTRCDSPLHFVSERTIRFGHLRAARSVTHPAIRHLAATDAPAHLLLPGVHKIASLLKRLLLGTHQGAVALEHLDYYLDESTFRFNRRTSASRGLLFYRLMEQAVCTAPVPCRQILGGTAPLGGS